MTLDGKVLDDVRRKGKVTLKRPQTELIHHPSLHKIFSLYRTSRVRIHLTFTTNLFSLNHMLSFLSIQVTHHHQSQMFNLRSHRTLLFTGEHQRAGGKVSNQRRGSERAACKYLQLLFAGDH